MSRQSNVDDSVYELFNVALGTLIRDRGAFRLDDICILIGRNSKLTRDYFLVRSLIEYNKRTIQKLWEYEYEQSPEYAQDYYDNLPVVQGKFGEWKEKNPAHYSSLRTMGLSDPEIIQLLVLERQWTAFITFANRHNVFLIVSKSRRYKQPDFWEYQEAMKTSLKRVSLQQLNILKRYQHYGMILPNADSINRYLVDAFDTVRALSTGMPKRFNCVLCLENGAEVDFRSKEELETHVKEEHRT